MSDLFDPEAEDEPDVVDPPEAVTPNGRISAGVILAFLRKKHRREPTDEEVASFAEGMREAAAALDEALVVRRIDRTAVTLADVRPAPKKRTSKRREKSKRIGASEEALCSCGIYGHTEDLCPEKA